MGADGANLCTGWTEGYQHSPRITFRHPTKLSRYSLTNSLRDKEGQHTVRSKACINKAKLEVLVFIPLFKTSLFRTIWCPSLQRKICFRFHLKTCLACCLLNYGRNLLISRGHWKYHFFIQKLVEMLFPY